MKATLKQIDGLPPLVKEIWPEHSLESLNRILKNYIERDESDVYVHFIDKEVVSLPLVARYQMRHHTNFMLFLVLMGRTRLFTSKRF